MQIDVILNAGMSAREFEELGSLAESYGIHCLWGSNFVSRRDPLLAMTGLGRMTSRIRLGTMPMSPYEMHPMRIAESLLTFNELSGGRAQILIGGLGRSVSRVTGLRPARRVDAVRDCVSILKGISASAPLQYHGELYTLTDYLPEWADDAMPRVYVGATGPRMLRMSAAIADGIMMADVPLLRVPEVRAQIDAGLADAARPAADLRVSNFFAWHLKEDRQQSMAEARRELAWRGLLQPWHTSTFLTESEARFVESKWPAFLQAFLARSANIEGVPDAIVDQLIDNLTFAGDLSNLERTVDRLRAFAAAGMDEIAFKVHDDPEEGIRLIGEHVLPALA